MALSWLYERLEVAREILTPSNIAWAVAGGWALDLFLGYQTRDHADLDLAIWRRDQHKLRAALTPDWVLEVADNDTLRPWSADRHHPLSGAGDRTALQIQAAPPD